MIDILEKIVAPLVAALLGALAAFRYQYKIELRRERRSILQVLMAYRNVGAYEIDWIKALNMIDVVYHNDEKVITLLHKYFGYTKPPIFETGQHLDVLFELIYEMGRCSGYKNLSLEHIRDIYSPTALDTHYPAQAPKEQPKAYS